jgi:hypothetical protein
MADHTVVATANILYTLPHHAAREALRGVLDSGPDLVGLQEWGLRRRRLLRESGRVWLPVRRGARPPGDPSLAYLWCTPVVGGCPVGVLAARFEMIECGSRLLERGGRSDRGARPFPLMPPRFATVAVVRDLQRDQPVSLINFHLTPGVQARGRYREDRPLLVARHREEVRSLDRLVGEQLALGRTVYAVGDSNFDGLRLTGLTSAWEGREGGPGTLGSRRKIDDVHGPGRSESVSLLASASDHKAVVVRRADRCQGSDRAV